MTAGSIGIASAATSKDSRTSIVDTLATKFGLNKDEVQKVFDEQKASMHAEREAKIADKIAELVKDGKLTQDQADKLTARAKELQTQREANRDKFKDLSKEERKAQMDKDREAISKWFSDNKIDEKYARFIFGAHRGHSGPDGPHGRMEM